MQSNIEFEIEKMHAPYEYIRELVKKICEDHEGKRNLHIKLVLPDLYLEQPEKSNRLADSNSSDVMKQIIDGITKIVSENIDDMARSGLAHFSENTEKCIRNIARDEFSNIMWRDLHSRCPELVKELRAKFPALVPDLPE